MYQHHTHIFVTFSDTDRRAASRYMAELAQHFPAMTFLGRYRPSSDIAADLRYSTLTLVLETSKTCTSAQVLADVTASLAKSPPNVIVKIRLEKSFADSSSPLAGLLTQCGAEAVNSDMASAMAAIERSETLYNIQPLISQAATIHIEGACNR